MEKFDFRIIHMGNGVDVFDMELSTPYASLTPLQMVEYIEAENQLAFMERMKAKYRRNCERRKKIVANPFHKIACMCGLL